MDTLYRSAGHYVALWERCRQLAPTSRLQPVSAQPTGLALVTAIDGHYLVACGTRGGVRTIHRNGAGRWQDHQLTAAPTALLSGLEANPGGPGYPVVSVIDPQGRGWFNRLSATTPWLFLDPNGLPPLAAMVALEGASQTDLYAMTGDGTLSVSVLRHGPGVSIAPDPWMPLDGLAPVGPGASLYGFGDGSGQYHLVLITAAGELLVSRRRSSATTSLTWWRPTEARYSPGAIPAGAVAGAGRLRLIVPDKAGSVLLDLDLDRDQAAVRSPPIGLTAGVRPILAGDRVLVIDGSGRLLGRDLREPSEPWYELHSRVAPWSRVAAAPLAGGGTLVAATDTHGRIWLTTWARENQHSGWMPLPH